MLCLDDILSTLNWNAKLLRELYYVQTTFDKEVDLANVEYLKPYIKEHLLTEVKYAG
ncbi:MAG TPA: hypothetical protein PKI59_07660 [Candidatus Cloacimonadota bacterium]|nr:hypothetical protein [Candidatus Cloacimonadota bacterium]